VYEEHNAAVIREVPADRLLVIAPDAGWEPLCELLRVPVPDEPYPHLNDPERFWARVAARVSEARDASAARVSEPRPTESSLAATSRSPSTPGHLP
jgi:hypothetical protein